MSGMTGDHRNDHLTDPPPDGHAREAADLVRSEERLDVTTHVREAGRVRVAKRVVTEQRVVTVEVRREELVVEELPADPHRAYDPLVCDQTASPGGARTAPPAVEMWLSEEEVEVTTRVVPKERVRVFVDTITEPVEVGGTVAREVVEADGLDIGR
jgi:uncharacterized protein (TIGR02271 family)